MRLSPSALTKLTELARRRPVALASEQLGAQEMAETLRAFLYDKQRAFFAPGAGLWRATRKTRRVGITTGGCRELLARAIEQSDFRAMYVATTRQEARDRAWTSDTKSGLVDVLRLLAEAVPHPTLAECYKLGGVTVDVREADNKLVFSNGAEIELFGSENLRSQRKKRGGAKHVVWIDEAQDFFLLEEFVDGVIIPLLADYEGELWLTGTPGKDCVGMFYEVTKEIGDGDEPLANWVVHEFSVTDNPHFGRVVTDSTAGETLYYVEDNTHARTGPYTTEVDATKAAIEVRWERSAGAAKRAKGWKGDEPDFIREWLGKWVKADARYVYPVHAVPQHTLLYAPQRLADNPLVGTHPRFDEHPPWYDHHMAVRDLPRARHGFRPHQWLYSLGVDFGYSPDPFAMVLWAFTPDLPDVYEMFSWKCVKVHTDDQARYMRMIWDVEQAIVSFVGDPAGKQDDFEVWRTRMNLPIEEANKKGKNTLEEFLADDIRRGRVHLRAGSPLHTEMKHLVYLPGKVGKTREVHKHRKIGGVVHGDHCCDAGRYSYSDLTHYLAKIAPDKPAPGSRQALELEAEQDERRIETRESRRAQQLADRDEMVEEYGGYQWD
jgi:terminase large subunit-like protein